MDTLMAASPADTGTTMSTRRRLLSGGGWTLAGRLVVAASGLLTSALLTRLLSSAEVASYLLAVSVVSLGALVGGLGLPQVVVRLVAQARATSRSSHVRSVLRTAFLIGVPAAVGAGLLYLVAAAVLDVAILAGNPGLGAVPWLVALWIAAATVSNLLVETFRGLGDIRTAAAVGGPVSAVLVLGALAGAALAAASVALSDVIVMTVAATLAGVTIAVVVLRRVLARLPRENGEAVAAGSLLRIGTPLFGTGLLLFALTQADLWVVAAVLPAPDLASYAIATRIATLVGLPLLVTNGVLPPLVAELYSRGRRTELERALRKVTLLSAVPALCLAAIFSIAGRPLLDLVYGPHYTAGAGALALLAIGQVVNVCAGPCGLTLAMSGHQTLLVVITAVTGALTVLALLLAVPEYGLTGAALTAAGGLALQNLAMLVGARRATGMWTHLSLAPAVLVVHRLTRRTAVRAR
jgi:O-antigen/teichoic acid export membrane protein